MRPKVFFIGFNKTATTAFHHMFNKSGYHSVHCLYRGANNLQSGVYIAKVMSDNLDDGREILFDIDQADVYSDFLYCKRMRCIEGNKWFKKLYAEYPDAYFVLQTRNEIDWLNSRLNHKNGSLLERWKKFNRMSEEEVILDWKTRREVMEKKIRKFFSGSNSFLEFNIDKHDISRLIEFVSPHYDLDRSEWKILNKTV